MKLALGLMSGTSADGVSLALGAFNENTCKLVAYRTFPYPARLAKKILSGPRLEASEISKLNMELGIFFAACARRFLKKWKTDHLAVIGSHGQTIYHGGREKPANTLQIGEPSVLAEQTGFPVVADFRMRDLAAGGQGAPLMPFFDQFFFGKDEPAALQNIGGIANVTLVGKGLTPIAFDNGPGNCLIDWAVQKATKGRLSFDKNGAIAARGKVNLKAVKKMAAHPYFKMKPPKSTGRELFGPKFIPSFLLKERPETLIATLTYFTAFAIFESARKFLKPRPSRLIVSGGGALNPVLMNFLAGLFPVPVESIEKYGLPVQAKEPLAFAFFALRALEGKTNHLPSGTGAKRVRILGKIIPGNFHADA